MNNLRNFHKKLHAWYAKHGRKGLPWRNTNDAYAIYISEVMLQQTQVKTVLERYYFQFLERFPTLDALAKASEKDVLTAWQGLGYYSRARNLHKTAIQCGGKLPKDVESLMVLPGIGRNTAHAVASFAYHAPVPVLEANVKRVIARLFAIKTPQNADIWDISARILDDKNPFDYNQAMMDIGATVCTKRAPKCGECPAHDICEGRDTPEAYPTKNAKKPVPVRNKMIVVNKNNKGEYFATPRTSKFLSGLYHFEEHDAAPNGKVTFLGAIRQQYSHFTLEADVYLLSAKKTSGKDWYSLAKLKKLPFSMAEKKILKMLEKYGD